MSEDSCDVAVIGGGPAGAAVAVALRRKAPSLSVTLVERSTYDAPRLGETLPPDVRLPLSRLGVWEGFLRDGHLASRGTASCWGRAEPGFHDTMMSPWGSAWHLDRARFDERLSVEAARQGARVLRATTLLDSEALGRDGYRLRLAQVASEPGTLRARFVVDATGGKATFASARGARRLVSDRCFAVYGAFQLPGDAVFPTHALVESCPEGWWYSALLPGGRVVVALVGDGDSLRGLRWATPEPWMNLLRQAPETRARLDVCDFAGEALVAVPVLVGRLDRPRGEQWLAVGDAACTYDPLSSQGITKALDSALLAADALERCLRGDADALQAYESTLNARFQDHQRTRAAYYRQEQRWPQAPFWRNRWESLPAPSAPPARLRRPHSPEVNP
ncbi:NAD(P)/FAD-dependent oxidoreductase [Corallococcus interemptor]|uniref:NAD(P)/FAD-dependent oxidoreductase n=1 Tax=Corallococcus interemptor TaxID=2316720 RepID=A0A3A8QE80_9BACT|nr:tryptophan 7-halogenase [Corallococcus interemptor]RKH50684.1 NAD(P)/FAD-dependent oxidoreductase [Corallococcus sp. AB050B]RKH63142.1 NAD(P)/FAD-dependent oxidoreductase [Corallococcus interemptor]